MPTRQRSHHILIAACIFFTQQILLFPLVESFCTDIVRAKRTSQWQQRRDRNDAPQLFFAPPGRGGRNHFAPGVTSSASGTAERDEASYPLATVEEPTEGDDEKLDMPWSDVQEWALNDNLDKFTVIMTPPITGGKPRRYAMWRTLTREVPELAGYPIPFLLRMHQRSLKKDAGETDTSVEATPGILPMVDDFEFTSNGGVLGRAFGLPGIADGTRIQTPSLVSAETTVPLGYVTTKGESNSEDEVGFSYELGTCASSSAYSLDGTERSAALAAARRLVVEGAADSTRQAAAVAKEMAVSGSGLLSDTEANKDLVYLGGATAMLLASATAVGMLSHHLTVNVFWV
mmetsp:Transcript_13675/g.29662  ORF Transcript_13675/g.29662 Transcript_13675/m.29662 type:complete len:345 (-) Transcript_13675:51-1085(-)|eukprot:CAMPEP_0172554958 /NCGR_PEP_ID=MMETSP1067-20121228/57320_1 /TAXON_ID=265564 ORGANISM="Thalassiosira punctigera, Strain Tpunct2005C2" /NCGR_SAMPLE_ID=MMETSP1067 /ASSEMBLY_ACC=CAM_ASM_000444 /LENGTH=344 /DNA_ID=CAMNT_0013343445 /DNA_START=78 /DNA_END=1112 /DNA_ORIENTATION=-